MHPLAETLLDEPVIAAVKTDDALTAALASPCSTVFLLASTLLNVAYFAPVTYKAFFGKRPEGEETGIREAPLTNKQARDFLRMFLSGASAETPDSQNRITIPPPLRAYAGLERELVVTGVGAHAEIWDAQAWNDYLEGNEAAYSEMEQEVIPGLF